MIGQAPNRRRPSAESAAAVVLGGVRPQDATRPAPSPTEMPAPAYSSLCVLALDTVARDADIHLSGCSRPIPVCPLHDERVGALGVPKYAHGNLAGVGGAS